MSDPRPVFDQVNLVVHDMEAMVEFYRRLGLDIPDEPAPWAAHHRSAAGEGGLDFDLDSTVFASQWNVGWPEGKTGAVIGFKVESRDAVDAVYADLTSAGYRGQQPPFDAFWGARYAVVADPDGNSVGIMSPVDPSMRSAVDPPS